ncbi:hypothetical protein PMZ80_004206 [Knufia obscura]|uniref:Heterokaryon incompatibility domain-containing protein n=1 Tax=Knufia obscura TaxID=1635080 RepID=A0ABR0RRF3_9EURO|nr:hypothetical protein PMZ80_004206 [Knufia obscura]
MDWIPRPAKTVRKLPEVPCLSEEDYDHEEWQSYPERQGYQPRSAEAWINFFQKTTAAFSAFVERWLFWGALEHILDKHLAIEHYKRPLPSGDGYVTRIATLIQQVSPGTMLRSHEESFTTHIAFAVPCHDRHLLGRTSRQAMAETMTLHRFCQIHSDRFNDTRTQELFLAICMLHELTPSESSKKLWRSDNPEVDFQEWMMFGATILQPMHSKVSENRLLQLGWCPWEAHMLSSRFSMPVCFFLSQMQRPDSHNVHEIEHIERGLARRKKDADGESRTFCTNRSCKWKSINQETYRTAHLHKVLGHKLRGVPKYHCGGCTELSVDLQELARILHAGHLPLLKVDDIGMHGFRLQLYGYGGQQHPRYIAFSHVWSDGLGNLEGNNIPVCRLLHIKEIIQDVNSLRRHAGHQDVPYFWLDTLCVPPDTANVPNVQSLAMHKMRATYSDARLVVVLDKWLTETSTDRMTSTEKLARLICSPWTRRLWTLQEGWLAQNHSLLFEFEDEVVNSDIIFVRLKRSKWPLAEQSLTSHVLGRYVELRYWFTDEALTKLHGDTDDRQQGINPVFSLLLPSLKFRATSMPGDEALCMAVLLNLDVKLISNTPQDFRMLVLWRQLKTIPMQLLYWDMPRYLPCFGARWAPSTLLDNQSTSGELALGRVMDVPRTSAEVTSAGLLTALQGIIFSIPEGQTMLESGGQLRLDCGVRRSFCLNSHRLQVHLHHRYKQPVARVIDPIRMPVLAPAELAQGVARRLEEWSMSETKQFALIWLERYDVWEGPLRGILVAVERVVSTAYVVDYIEGVDVDLLDREDDFELDWSSEQSKDFLTDAPIFKGKETLPNQLWLIN